MALRIKKSYKITHLCTDDYNVYKKFEIAINHSKTKAETSLVEAKNSSSRDNLARLNRRTKRISKTFEMLELTIYLFIFWKNFNYINIF